MALVRCIMEMGMGVDVHGRDYTSAAERAVFDAIHHSSLGFQRLLGKTADDMQVEVTIGVPNPGAVDRNAVAAVYQDLRSALFGQARPPLVLGRYVGLGGRDVTNFSIMYMAEEALKAARQGHAEEQLAWHFRVIEDEEMLAQAME